MVSPAPSSSSYARALSIPGALRFSAAGVVARLPISMAALGIVVLVSSTTGSWSQGGALSATYLVANGLTAVPLARLVDRRGQGRVLGLAATVSATALTCLLLAVQSGSPFPLPHLFAILAGLATPNIGGAVRARWSHVSPDRATLDTAFALEAVNDEVVFIVGPVLTTLLASAVHPAAGLATAAAAAVLGGWWLASQRGTEPRVRAPAARAALAATRAPMPWAQLSALLGCAVLLGVLFGGSEVATVAFADAASQPALGGVLLALWAAGSLVSGLVAGTVAVHRSAATRHRAGYVVLAVLMLPLPFMDGLAGLGAVLLLAGMAISPTLIAAASWVEGIVPPERLNEGLAVYSTGVVVGLAPGAAFTGVVVDTHGASAAYWVPVVAGLSGAVVATVAAAYLRRAAPRV